MEVLAAHGGAQGLRDRALLESAVGGVDDWEALVVDVAASRIDRKETTRRLRRLLA